MNLRTFRLVALAEATSFLILLVFTVIKYTADFATGVEIMGPVHGALFLVYVFLGLMMAIQLKWTLVQTAVVLLAAVVPTGGYFVDKWLNRLYRAELQR